MIYTGIGARKTPKDDLVIMQGAAKYLARKNHILRSGGARGADTAFEVGCDESEGKKEIYLPYKNFNHNQSSLYQVTKEARLYAKDFHPNWSALGPTGQDFMGRNVFQLLGLDLQTPTDFVVCYTPKGQVVGGTGMALRIANHLNIPVVNLGSDNEEDVVKQILALIEKE